MCLKLCPCLHLFTWINWDPDYVWSEGASVDFCSEFNPDLFLYVKVIRWQISQRYLELEDAKNIFYNLIVWYTELWGWEWDSSVKYTSIFCISIFYDNMTCFCFVPCSLTYFQMVVWILHLKCYKAIKWRASRARLSANVQGKDHF